VARARRRGRCGVSSRVVRAGSSARGVVAVDSARVVRVSVTSRTRFDLPQVSIVDCVSEDRLYFNTLTAVFFISRRGSKNYRVLRFV